MKAVLNFRAYPRELVNFSISKTLCQKPADLRCMCTLCWTKLEKISVSTFPGAQSEAFELPLGEKSKFGLLATEFEFGQIRGLQILPRENFSTGFPDSSLFHVLNPQWNKVLLFSRSCGSCSHFIDKILTICFALLILLLLGFKVG